MPSSLDPATVVQAVYTAFGSGSVATLLALSAQDSTWIVNAPKEHPFGGTWKGHSGLQQFLARIAASVEILDIGADETHVSAEEVFVVGHEKGRWKASGKPYATRWVHRFRVKSGRIAMFEEWFDTATAMATMR